MSNCREICAGAEPVSVVAGNAEGAYPDSAGALGTGRMAGDAASGSIGGCGMRTAPELLEVDNKQLEDVLRRAEQSLDEEDSHLIRRLFESYTYVSDLIKDKNSSICRLRQLFFGSRTEKTEADHAVRDPFTIRAAVRDPFTIRG